MCYFTQEYATPLVEMASFNNLSVNYSTSCTSMCCCFTLPFVMLHYVSIVSMNLDPSPNCLLPLRYATLHYVLFRICHQLTSSLVRNSELIPNSYLFPSILFLMLLSLSLSIPLLQLLYPTPHHRSCYRPFPVFYRKFTGARSVPREHREEHKVREDQGPNLLSRDLLRTPPPPTPTNASFKKRPTL